MSITNNTAKKNCMDVSHANVTITLVGDNMLSCGVGDYGALVKDGMDDTKLVIQCEHIGEKHHQCKKGVCGTLDAKGTVYHATSIGSSNVNREKPEETGASNLIFKGGIVNAKAGEHMCAIGTACSSIVYGGYAKNIRIEGGIITALGGEYCAGIGGSYCSNLDGLYITGGTIYASGGKNAPGIGSGGGDDYLYSFEGLFNISNIEISGGDTVVKAIGDKATNMPGIGCGKAVNPNNVPGVATNVVAFPNSGYQGYIQDGTSETEYNFTKDSPFQDKQDIKVDQYFTMVYFGPFRDENKINPDTKEQLGANYIISKTGGEKFSEEKLKELARINGKDKDGDSFAAKDILLTNDKQVEAINEAKVKGEKGEFPLTLATSNGTEVTIIVFLRGNGTDGAEENSNPAMGMVGANDIENETGGDAFTEEELKELCNIKGKDKEGNNFKLEDFKIDSDELKAINEAKIKKNTGKFSLTYETPDGESVTVEVLLTGTVEVSFDTDGGSTAPEDQKIDSGTKLKKPENPEKEGYTFEGWFYTDKDGNEVQWDFEDPVYEKMTLKAKWQAEPTTEKSEVTTTEGTTETRSVTETKRVTEENRELPDWEFTKRAKRTEKTVTQTGDQTELPFLVFVLGVSIAGMIFFKKSRK